MVTDASNSILYIKYIQGHEELYMDEVSASD